MNFPPAKRVKDFVLTLVVAYLAMQGLESCIHDWFGFDFHHWLSGSTTLVVAFWGFKLHLFCCILPAAISVYVCARKKHRHCNHTHEEQNATQRT